MTVEAQRNPEFRDVVNRADFATADGMPIVKSLRWLSNIQQERVAGNDLMPALLKIANDQQLKVFFYGGTEGILESIYSVAQRDFPALSIAGSHSPPFRPLTDEEMDRVAAQINASGANIVFVSLGCPKQERWMAAMHNQVNALMVGVGGAFLLYAGHDSRAPLWMRTLCLEWLYRLALEPRRLWKRYLISNTVFTVMFLRSWLSGMFNRSASY